MQTEQEVDSGNPNILKPRKALNKAFLKVKPNRSRIEQFDVNLVTYYFQLNTAKEVRRLFPKVIMKDLRKFPIRIPSPEQQLSIIERVDKVMDLKKENPAADSTSSLEAEIDRLVYELYVLTEEEIIIVEDS